MNDTRFTTLPVSRLIHEKVPEMKYESWRDEKDRPRIGYRLDDCIRAIVAHLKECTCNPEPEVGVFCDCETSDEACNRLLTAYLEANCNMADPRVGEILTDIFK